MLVPRNYDRKGVDLKSVTGWTLSSVGVIALEIGGAQLIQGLSEGNDAAIAARNAECYDDCADTFWSSEELLIGVSRHTHWHCSQCRRSVVWYGHQFNGDVLKIKALRIRSRAGAISPRLCHSACSLQ